MKKHLYLLIFCLLGIFTFPACTQKEDAVLPGENCDVAATVQLVPSCGLLLVLENNQKLVPLNVSTTTNAAGDPIYKIDNFEVQVGQQVIIGYKTAKADIGPTPCNQTGYYTNKLVNVTCIVSIEISN